MLLTGGAHFDSWAAGKQSRSLSLCQLLRVPRGSWPGGCPQIHVSPSHAGRVTESLCSRVTHKALTPFCPSPLQSPARMTQQAAWPQNTTKMSCPGSSGMRSMCQVGLPVASTQQRPVEESLASLCPQGSWLQAPLSNPTGLSGITRVTASWRCSWVLLLVLFLLPG